MSIGDSLVLRKEYVKAKSYFDLARELAEVLNLQDGEAALALKRMNEADSLRILIIIREKEARSIIAAANNLGIQSRNSLAANQYQRALELGFQAKQELEKLDSFGVIEDHPQIELAFGEAVQGALTERIYSFDHEITSMLQFSRGRQEIWLSFTFRDIFFSLLNLQLGHQKQVKLAIEQNNHLTAATIFDPNKKLLLAFENLKGILLQDDSAPTTIDTLGHDSPVLYLASAPNGNYFLSCSRDDKAMLWSDNLELLATLDGHQGNVYEGAFSPVEEIILTRSVDGTVKLWDFQGKNITTITGHTNYIHSAAFSPDGEHILTASADYSAKLWDKDGGLISTFPHEGIVREAIFLEGGKKILTYALDKTIRIWDLTGPNENPIILSHPDQITTYTLVPSKELIIIGTVKGDVWIWGLDGKFKDNFRAQEEIIVELDYSIDKNLLLSTGAEGVSKLWNLAGNQLMTIKLSPIDWVVPAHFTLDGQYILSVVQNSVSICPIPELAYEQMKN